MDLVCVVADANMEAAIEAVFTRPESLNVKGFSYEVIRHPRRDPGCFHEADELLTGYRDKARRALVILDLEWNGCPADSASELEEMLEEKLLRLNTPSSWASAVVIEPELEAWVFSDSPHVADVLGWSGSTADLRKNLMKTGLWKSGQPKPTDPKAAVEWSLDAVRRPRSSSLYRELGRRVSLDRCSDRAFVRLRELLTDWFGQNLAQSP